MARKTKAPGERRRQQRRSKKKAVKFEFDRPCDWAEQELFGVRAWLLRLKGPEGQTFPPGWCRGMIKHYEKRARLLRAEIAASKRQSKEDETRNDPS